VEGNPEIELEFAKIGTDVEPSNPIRSLDAVWLIDGDRLLQPYL
jgi:hypothetical protein